MEIVALIALGAVLLKPSLVSGLFGGRSPAPYKTAGGSPGAGSAGEPGAGQQTANGGPQLNALGTGGQQTPGGTAPQPGASAASQAIGIIGGLEKAVAGAIGLGESVAGSSNVPSNLNDNGTADGFFGSQPGQFDSVTPGAQENGWDPSIGDPGMDTSQGTVDSFNTSTNDGTTGTAGGDAGIQDPYADNAPSDTLPDTSGEGMY